MPTDAGADDHDPGAEAPLGPQLEALRHALL